MSMIRKKYGVIKLYADRFLAKINWGIGGK